LPLRLLILALVPLSGCKTWYRPASNQEDLAADRQRCADETGTSSGQAMIACMERLGWRHSDTDSRESAVTEDETRGAAGQKAIAAPQSALGTPAPSQVSSDAAGEAEGQPAGPRDGWIQFGADSDGLNNARAHCDAAQDQSFDECMRSLGWTKMSISVEAPDDSD
jgi:hypothetical protein